MMSQDKDNRDRVVTVGLGGDNRRGGDLTGGEGLDAPTKPSLLAVVQTGEGKINTDQVGNLLFSSGGCKNNVVDAATGMIKSFNKFDAKPKNNVVDAGLAKLKKNDNLSKSLQNMSGLLNDNERDECNSTDDANGISTLNLIGIKDSNVNLADVTYVHINQSFYDDSLISTDSINDIAIVKDGEIEEMEVEASGEKIKKGRSFPMTTNERRKRKNQLKAEKRKYKIPEDPFMAKVDQEYMKRKTYSECVKRKNAIILEVRAEDLEVPLDTSDFRLIDRQLLFKYLECKQQNLAELDESSDDREETSDDEADQENKFFYGVIGGISNGAVWLACDNETTADFVKFQVPLIANKERKYQVFTSETKPFRYMRAKIPVEFWGDRKTVEGLFRISNKCLSKKIRNKVGIKRKVPHFKVSYGCENYEDDLDEEDARFYWVQFEVDERILTKIADEKGRLRLGSNQIMLLGGGMVTLAKEKIASQLKEAVNTIKDGSG
jgi:hypothetical protein